MSSSCGDEPLRSFLYSLALILRRESITTPLRRASTVKVGRSLTSNTLTARSEPYNRIMIPIGPMNDGLPVMPPSWAIGAFPHLEAMFPPGSNDRDKTAYLLSLFQMVLEPDDDVWFVVFSANRLSKTSVEVP